VRGLFVTATDTGVGKTEVACALVSGARLDGLDVGVMKPAQSGVTPGEPSDSAALHRGGAIPWRWSAPTASPRRWPPGWRPAWPG
jgi:dethiobiotin synthetase